MTVHIVLGKRIHWVVTADGIIMLSYKAVKHQYSKIAEAWLDHMTLSQIIRI